jgi:hypothetical protein
MIMYVLCLNSAPNNRYMLDREQDIQLFEIFYHQDKSIRLIHAFNTLEQAEMLIENCLPDFSKVTKSEIKEPFISIDTPTYAEGVKFQMFFCRNS